MDAVQGVHDILVEIKIMMQLKPQGSTDHQNCVEIEKFQNHTDLTPRS